MLMPDSHQYPSSLNLIKIVEDNVIFFGSKSVYFCKFLHCFLKTWIAQVTFVENPHKWKQTV